MLNWKLTSLYLASFREGAASCICFHVSDLLLFRFSCQNFPRVFWNLRQKRNLDKGEGERCQHPNWVRFVLTLDSCVVSFTKEPASSQGKNKLFPVQIQNCPWVRQTASQWMIPLVKSSTVQFHSQCCLHKDWVTRLCWVLAWGEVMVRNCPLQGLVRLAGYTPPPPQPCLRVSCWPLNRKEWKKAIVSTAITFHLWVHGEWETVSEYVCMSGGGFASFLISISEP